MMNELRKDLSKVFSSIVGMEKVTGCISNEAAMATTTPFSSLACFIEK
jgi:hypothetical protein